MKNVTVEKERIIDLMQATQGYLDKIQTSIHSVLQQREIESRKQLSEQAHEKKQKELQETEQWHLHIQHFCEVSQALVRTMEDLEQELQEPGLTAEQERLSALVAHHISALQLADQKISAEEKISEQNREEILKLLARCQKNLDEIGQLINPILYQKYLGEREEPEEGRAAQWQAPEGVDANHAAREKYQSLLQQAQAKISRGEPLDDELFAQLVAHRKQMSGLLSAEQAPAPEQLQWYIHYGLLKQAYQKAVEENDLMMRQKVGFLILFYLVKVTPLSSSLKTMPNVSLGIDTQAYAYYRNTIFGKLYDLAKKALLEKMILSSFFNQEGRAEGVLNLLDHKEVGDLLKESYHVLNTEGKIDQIVPGSEEEEALVTEWATEIKKCISEALEQGQPINEIRKRFLFDFTKDLEKEIQFLEGDKARQEAVLRAKMSRINALLDRAIKEASTTLKESYPEQLVDLTSEVELRYFIQRNGIAICRGTIDNISYATELPLLQQDQKTHFLSRTLFYSLQKNFVPFAEKLSETETYFTRKAEINMEEIVEREQAKYVRLLPYNRDEEINQDKRAELIATQIAEYYNQVLDENYATARYHLFLDFTAMSDPLSPAGFTAMYAKAVDDGIDQAVVKIFEEKKFLQKEITPEMLAFFIRQNLCCICTTPTKEGKSVITVLRVINSDYKEEKKFRPTQYFSSFITDRGLKIGIVRLPYNLFDNKAVSLEHLLTEAHVFPEVEYAPQGEEKTVYYPEIQGLLKLRLFNQLHKRATIEQERYPHIAVITKATVDLFTGMLQEINVQLEKEGEGGPLHALYNSSITQSTLHRLLQHLAAAENMTHDTGAFFNAIELAHAELTTLITLFQPYSTEDFSKIFKERLQHIPNELQGLTQAGVGTSASFIFSCINEAVAKTTPERKPQKAYSEGLYYEEAVVMGNNTHIGQLVEDENVTQIDFYAAQFNHNLDPGPEHTHYAATKVIENIEAILEKKKDTKRLTVAIDCTIDFTESPQIKLLLEHFSEQIRDGTLNFVFFGSGQKFALLGQDNYYGAPFYVVNNGDEHWAPFKALTSEERFQTDPLSQQWFCLSNQYAFDSLEAYRRTIFANHREALDRLAKYAPQQEEQAITVCTVEEEMQPCFIDVRIPKVNDQDLFIGEIEKVFKEDNQPLGYRASFGFMHTSINRIGGSYRITLGLDPKDIDRLIRAFENFSFI